MAQTPAEKLHMKADQRWRLFHAPLGYPAALGTLPAGIELRHRETEMSDAILFFSDQQAMLVESLPTLLPTVAPETLFWIAYRKGGAKVGTDLNRDRLVELLHPWGWTSVTLIALDEVWSAMRFRPLVR